MTTNPESAVDGREQRAEVHRALGDPLRLAIVEALATSDMTPSEAEARFAVSSNLLAHHLATLEEAGIVERTRSQGDARRRYLSLRRDALAVAGVSMGAPDSAPLEAARVVFVCTRNSARSPLAAALWDELRDDIPATSAGTHPAEAVHPLAVAAGRQAGLALRHQPQSIEGLTRPDDLVVTICDQAREERGAHDTRHELHWSIPDPVRDGRPEAFAGAVGLLRERITYLAEHTARAS
jgi:protein-tyrosine-phosphatase/DNA-binding HxlR family transcriptional regulator